jgi:arylsulfatase A-like enzyme
MFRRLLDSPWPYFVGAGLLVVVAVVTQFEVRLPARPEGSVEEILGLRDREHLNVVFLVVDTLRADRIGAYGYHRPTSENMDALARHGILFKNVLSQSSWTKTSMASLWTGALPGQHGILRFDDVVPEDAVMPAEVFQAAGYRTAGVWRNGWVAPNFGFGQGFGFYVNPKPGRSRLQIQVGHPAGGVIDGTDEDLILSAFEFLDNFGQERFFLYVHLMDLHQYVYDEGAPQFGTSYSDIYDQSLHWADRIIAHLHGRLDEIGQLGNTMIVITSDHGEAFLEHGFEGHARNLYSEVIDVPWIIALPFRLDPGIVVEERVSNVDVWPTVLDLVGLDGLVNPDGRSLVPLILAAAGAAPPDDSFRRPVISVLDRGWGHRDQINPVVAVTDGTKRIIYWPLRPRRIELFDLEADPGEQESIFAPDDPESKRLMQMAQDHLSNSESPWGAERETVELDELRLNQLRALGYVLR